MRGRPPKPTHLHVVQSTDRASRMRRRKREPQPVGDLTDPPPHLTRDQAEHWRYAIEHAPAGLLKRLDGSTLAVWCIAYDCLIKASRELGHGENAGLLLTSPTGNVGPNPLVH